MQQAFDELKGRLAQVDDLMTAAGLLEWDQQTMMPPRGATARAEHLATLTALSHEIFVADETGRLLDRLGGYEAGLPYESDEASLIRVARRDYEKSRRVPTELEAELARTGAIAYAAWAQARAASDFSSFLPHLERMLELKQRYVACFDVTDRAYDVLLDDFEPGMTTAATAAVFARLREALVPLVATIRERADRVDDSCLRGRFPIETQRKFVLAIIEQWGYDASGWRLDPTEHPFASGVATGDVRLTTRYDEGDLALVLFGTMHECGHGLYEEGVDPALARSPLARGASMALHESQSRMWENLVGRGRPFWRFAYPVLRNHFPEQFASVDEETVYRAVNKMQPSLIRVEADEATYNLHIILRFELEQGLIDGTIAPRDLPEIWNARMREFLGIDVPNDERGVLQDVHWSGGLFGYFPTYALGNVVSAQIWEHVRTEMPDLDERFSRGEFAPLREWLRERLHRHGRKFTTPETLDRVIGGAMDPEPLVRHLQAKVTELYGTA